MKTLIFSVFSALIIPAFCAEPPVWTADFEGQFPGEAPKGWRQSWGKQVDEDLKQISNMEVLKGNASLLIDRSGSDRAQWGFGTNFKDIADGRAVLTIPFQMQAGGGRAMNSGFEIFTHPYNNSSRLAALSFVGAQVTVRNGHWQNGRSIGRFEPAKWYRIVLKLPTSGGKQTDLIARLDLYRGDGKWTNGKEFSIEVGAPKGVYGRLLFVPNPDSKFKLYLDDLSFAKE